VARRYSRVLWRPARNLLDYLEGGYTLDEFLDDFPEVTKAQVVAFRDSGKVLRPFSRRAR
jgi:hypothetical protein